jgi:Xaa-Pro aminopeptidase
MMTEIPQADFDERIARLKGKLDGERLDAVITFGNEAEPQYVKYFSNYWPSFETAGVFIPRDGDACLLIGPESLTFSRAWSRIRDIRRMMEYRESSEPEYPGEILTTFPELFRNALGRAASHRRIGIVGYPLMPAPLHRAILEAARDLGVELVRAEGLVIAMKQIKSPNEIDLMRQAARISERAFGALVEKIEPGMTEIQVVGEAHRLIRDFGAESEAYPMWCSCGTNSTQAISRPTHRRIAPGELVQIQVGARLGGYASSIGRPMVFGNAPEELRRFISTGLEAHRVVRDTLRGGLAAREVDARYREFLRSRDAEKCILYGPCHGTGLMEGEHPWIERNSEFTLAENMTFCSDNFLRTDSYGLRWEDVVRITPDGVEEFTGKFQEVLVL